MDSLLLEGGWLFVGLHTAARAGVVLAFNTATGAQCRMEGHQVREAGSAGGGGGGGPPAPPAPRGPRHAATR